MLKVCVCSRKKDVVVHAVAQVFAIMHAVCLRDAVMVHEFNPVL